MAVRGDESKNIEEFWGCAEKVVSAAQSQELADEIKVEYVDVQLEGK